MAYFDLSMLRQDPDFINRVAACYSTETPLGQGIDPGLWATNHSWDVASAPGFSDAYAYAVANDNPAPGRDGSVITDESILAAVQAVINAESG